jgi:hypothetical protein
MKMSTTTRSSRARGRISTDDTSTQRHTSTQRKQVIFPALASNTGDGQCWNVVSQRTKVIFR